MMPGQTEEVFVLFVPGVGRGSSAGVEIPSGCLEMPVLVDSTETVTSGLSREVY